MKHTSRYINRYEFVLLFRQRWLQFILVVLLTLILFAVYNGKGKVDQRLSDARQAIGVVEEKDSLAAVLLDSIEAGLSINLPSWSWPNVPSAVGYGYPRVAVMLPEDLAILSTGQSDLYTHIVQPNLWSETHEENFTALANPVQLMFGNFDLSFVLIYLLPLLAIAFAYNILSQEREQGVLSVIASQPVSLYNWLFRRALLRYLLLSGMLALLLIVVLAVAGIPIIANVDEVAIFILLSLGYVLFWFVLACLVNLKGKSSANNAVWLISWWVMLVLLVPAIINLTANSIYPLPSRADLINKYRVTKIDAEKRADELLVGYLSDHPELAGFKGASEAWMKYYAKQDLIKKEVGSVMDGFEQEVRNRQQWVENFRFLSPSLLLQSAFNEISGTSSSHYESYRMQVKDFTNVWRNHFMPKIFKGESFTKSMLSELPEFRYQTFESNPKSITNTMALYVYCILMMGAGMLWSRSGKSKLLISQ